MNATQFTVSIHTRSHKDVSLVRKVSPMEMPSDNVKKKTKTELP